MRFSLIALGLLSCVVSGCGRESEAALPSVGGRAFDPIAFFDGHTHSWGVIEHRSGTPSESVMTDSHAERDAAGRLRMVQQLRFQDGTSAQRDWVLWRSGPDKFDATANDMAGTARGETNGRMFHWSWVWDRSPGNRFKSVTMNQWMYQMDDGSVTIRTTVTKFGFILAEVTEQFSRV